MQNIHFNSAIGALVMEYIFLNYSNNRISGTLGIAAV